MIGRTPTRVLLAVAVVASTPKLSRVAALQTPRGSPAMIAELAKKSTPRLANGRPDLNGTWDRLSWVESVQPRQLGGGSLCIIGCPPAPATASQPEPLWPGAQPNFPKYKPEFLGRVKDLDEHQVQFDPVLRCHAPGVPRIGPPGKIIHTAREAVFLYDDVSGAFFRIVPTDTPAHRKELPASYLGDAIGRWDGDTLVVETVNFNDETWLTDNGAFHTKDLKVVERLHRIGDTIQYEATATDPAVLAESWSARSQTLWLTDQELEEPARCEDRDREHIVDGSHHENPR
jgi:hypothetical protein